MTVGYFESSQEKRDRLRQLGAAAEKVQSGISAALNPKP